MTPYDGNQRNDHLGLRLVWLIGIFTIVSLISPNLFAKIFSNFGALGFLGQVCVPESLKCDPNHATYTIGQVDIHTITSYVKFYERALKYFPGDDKVKVHLAELAFMTGDRSRAVSWLSNVESETLNRSWLSYKDRYAAFLLAAWQEYLTNQWVEAVNYYRRGLFWAGDLTLMSDENAYYASLAKHYLAQRSTNASNYLLAGIYSYYAGQPEQAKEILTSLPVQLKSGSDEQRTLAVTYRYLGKIAADSDKHLEAEAAFQKSLELDPDNRLTIFFLLQSLLPGGKPVGFETLKDRINTLGPTYLLGVIGEGVYEQHPVLINDGWELMGYDIESQLIPDSHQINIYLWWKNTGTRPLGNMVIDTGDYFIQEQTVTNNLPNPGMEWGVDDRGIPVGYDREFYTGDPSYLRITGIEREGLRTSALVAENTSGVRSLALASRVIPVSPDEYTLMAGWIFHDQGKPNIGRNCWGDRFTPGGTYFIAYTRTQVSSGTWVHAADVSKPIPGAFPDYCEVLFINYESPKPAAWDQLLWVNISAP